MTSTQKRSWFRRTFFSHCDALGVGIWSCPNFIFVVMGAVIIASILTTYVIAEQHADPEVVIAIVSGLTIFLFIITQVLVNAFERVVEARQREATHAKEVLNLKDQFVYLAVHDLSSAATAVKWGLKMIENNPGTTLSSYEREVFASIRKRNEELISLVRQILLITRIERGPIELHPAPLLLVDFLNERVRTQWVKNARGNVAHKADIANDFPVFLTDKDLFTELIDIILFNAQEYSAQKEGAMSITAKMEKPDVVLITVENNGEGMPEDLKNHIFEKFWVEPKTGKIERVGFGLYIAQSIAHMFGGNITFTSDSNVTRFSIRLPLAPPANA